jgi:riboflavin kinase/FMN adenylyltransferase
MIVHRDIEQLPLFRNAVITIGTFDGVHAGHLQIIKQLKEEAARINGETVIITFHPHPRLVIQTGKSEIHLLNTLEEKTELLKKQDIDHLVVVPFTREFSEQAAELYIEDFLVKKFRPHTIIIGYDHHFGNKRKGDYRLLEAYAGKFNYVVKEIPEHVLNQVIISSTRIRGALLNADPETANRFLGYDYFFEGKVVEGNKLGRTLGYPTVNLELADANKLVPANGIYAVSVTVNNRSYNGMMSIGVRPTIGISARTVEVNIFDFDENIYGQTVRVFVKKYLREEKKFNDLDELKAAIAEDKINAIAWFSSRQ